MVEEPITIFIPVKNAELTIKNCVDSVLNQSYKNKIIWVIDNISSDRTYEILKKYGKKINLLRMAGTVPKLHNYVLKRTKTKFIAYTNADCVVHKDWLRNLLKGFNSNNIVATAGYCATPKGLNKLQELIGRELENRFKKFPEFISRAPDMNLCVRTDVAKKVKFDERFFWSWETDFGYRLTKLGKMKYVPKAIVYHYHRPNWKSFFKQQFRNASILPFLYWKHLDKIRGDHISTGNMASALLSMYLFLFFFMLSAIKTIFLIPSMIFLLIFNIIIFREIFNISKNIDEMLVVLRIFYWRTIAWIFGVPYGIYLFIKNKWYKEKT